MGRRINLWFWGILLLALALRLKGLNNPLLDNQAWRQADTASIATHMLGNLTDIPSVFLPHLNYDGIVPQKVELELPILPYVLAWIWTIFGWSDLWGRLLAIGASLFTVWGIYSLALKIFSRRTALIASAIYAVLPLAIYYGRVVMPEPVTQAISIWALNWVWQYRRSGNLRHVVIAALLMAFAILAKLPQLMLLPTALILGFWPINKQKYVPLILFIVIALLLPLIYYGWVHLMADSSNQFVSGIISEQVIGGQTLHWDALFKYLKQGISYIVLIMAGLGALRLIIAKNPNQLWLLVWLLINLFYVSIVCSRISLDYYLVPIMPLAAILSGYTLDLLKGRSGTVLAVIVTGMLIFNFNKYYEPKYLWNGEYLSQAKWIAQNTPDDSVLVLSDPPPMTFYYAGRAGFRLKSPSDQEALQELEQLPGEYLIKLPLTEKKDLFWQSIKSNYPEIGPGVFELTKKSHTVNESQMNSHSTLNGGA